MKKIILKLLLNLIFTGIIASGYTANNRVDFNSTSMKTLKGGNDSIPNGNDSACIASFIYQKDSVNNTYYFNSTSSSSNINNWVWDFGDGTTSNIQNPSHIYSTTGTFNVCLTVSEISNLQNIICSDTYCSNVIVGNDNGNDSIPTGNCVASFISYKDSVNINNTYYFNSTSSSSNINNWVWDFGDGTTSNIQNPSHIYSTTGTFNVCLTVSEISNQQNVVCSDAYCNTIVIGNGQNNCNADIYLVQDSSGTNSLLWYAYPSVTGTAPFSYLWDFGDGSTSTLQYPSHTYATPGHYNICLTITDANGCSSSTCETTKANRGESGFIQQLIVVDAAAGIRENTVSLNSVFPNPSNNRIEVSLSQSIQGELKITDITGREVYNEKVNSKNIIVDVSTLPAGYYTLSVVLESNTIQEKIMIVK
ncbi:MAG: PKD domain-containing protein [Bacteroidales bacterium]|jgi:PKD repeat protein